MTNILIFGDSIAYGDYDKEGGWVDRLKRNLKNKVIESKVGVDINVFNLSISGDTTSQLIKRLPNEIPQRCWPGHKIIIILAIGINDAMLVNKNIKTSERNFMKNLEEAILVCKRYSKEIVLVGLTPIDERKVTPMPWSPTEFYYNAKINKYNNVIKKLCKKNNLKFIDLFNKFNQINYKILLSDGAHPNTIGHKKIYNIVYKYIIENI